MPTMKTITGDQLGMAKGILGLSENELGRLINLSGTTVGKYLAFKTEPLASRKIPAVLQVLEPLLRERGYEFTEYGLDRIKE